MSLKDKQRQVREDAILDAAQQLMLDVGYEPMTMDDLAARVGISKPTLYSHFPSKEDIAVRSVVRMMRRGLSEIQALPHDLSARARLEHVVRHILTSKYVTRVSYLGAAREAIGPTLWRHPEYRAAFETVTGAVAEIVEDGKKRGEINTNLNTRILVQALFSVFRDSEYGELLQRGKCSANEMIETLVALLIGGMRP